MNSPLISCVVIAYNYEKYVRNAVDSVLAQTGFKPDDIEIIAVDDGSTDGTPSILASYGDRIRVIRQKNQGPVIAMAAGMAAARGKYLAFLDADDEWLPERLRAGVDHLEANPHVGLVHSDMSLVDGEGHLLHAAFLALPSNAPRTGNILGELLAANQVTTSTITVRADLARAVPQAPAWAWCRDWWLAAHIAVKHAITVLPAPLVRYRSHGGNVNGLVNRSAEKTHRLMERDVRVRRLLLRSLELSAVAPNQLTQALTAQLQTMGQLEQVGVDVKALIAVTDTDLAEVEALLTLAAPLARALPEEALRLAARAIAIDPFNKTGRQFFDTLHHALNASGMPQTAAPTGAAPPAHGEPAMTTDANRLWQQAASQQLAAACPTLLALPDLHALNPLQAWAVWQRLRALREAPRVLELGFGPWAAPLAVMTQALGGSFYSLGLDRALAEALVERLRHANAIQRVTVSLTERVDTELDGEPGQFLDLSELGEEGNFDLVWLSTAQALAKPGHATHALPATAERLASQSSFMLETDDQALQRLAASRWAALEDSLQFLPGSCHGTGLLVTIGEEQRPAVSGKKKRFVHFFYNNMHTQKVLSLFEHGGLDQDYTQQVFIERSRTIPDYDNDVSVYRNASFFSEQTDLPRIIESVLAPDVEGVFMHGLFFGWQHHIVRAVGQHKKVIWYMWGGDLYNPIRQKQPFFETVKHVHAVATGATGDYELFCRVYGHKPCLQMPYPTDIDFASVNMPARKSKTIFVGNSGDPSNLHIEVLQHLARKQDISEYEIVLPVTYNLHEPYKQQILAAAEKLGLARRIRLLTQHMSPAAYYALVAEVEIFVTAHQRQQAFGNLLAALYLGAKTVLRKEISIFEDGRLSLNPNWEFLEQTLHASPISYTDFVSCSRLSELPALDKAGQEAQSRGILDFYDNEKLTAVWRSQLELVAGA
jgi:hypothetical protein